jgi:asparagine synthase (glutamine-hydrolysing)
VCGINGILRLSAAAEAVSRAELLRSRDYMASRGPDGAGAWIAATGDAGLGHRRLAIIDLSEAASQPMSWQGGRYQIVFNGEIYNYRELREELVSEGVDFHSHGDTEVVLALYGRDGVGALSRLRGMYALAIWDSVERTLLLARDPYGIKPLYYAIGDGYLRFASQVKALEAGGAVSREVDPAGVVGFLLWGSVPEPFTIRRAVRALPAGHHLLVRDGRVGDPRSHYRFRHHGVLPQPDPAKALEDSVRAHLVADVPIAVFLSAGLDSSLLAALACRYLPEPPVTLTLSFESFAGTPLDEAPLAREVARCLGTRHVERRVGREEFRDLWPDALRAMDQPTVDGLNVYLISRVAHEAGLKVVISGLGGDEIFGSYSTFSRVPAWRRRVRTLRAVPGLKTLWAMMPTRGGRWAKLPGLLRFGGSLPGTYFLQRGLFLPQELPRLVDPALVTEGLAAYDPLLDLGRLIDGDDGAGPGAEWRIVHRLESGLYLRNQLLRDADWASMAHSLELRVPLVDPWLREQMATLDFEPARSRGKAALVRSIAPELPAALWARPKSGFFIPMMEWLDEPSRDGARRRWGRDARQLALRVLKEFRCAS